MHEKKKLKEVVRLGGLYILLTKERGFGLQGTINYGGMTSMYLETMGEKSYFSKVCFCSFILV